MSRWRSEKTVLHIGARHIVLERAGVRQPLATVAGEWAALAAELAPLVRARLRVHVADCWARYFLLDPPAGVAGLRDCALLLDARFEALYGQPPTEWVVQADWQAGAPMLACALPRALCDALAGFRLAGLWPNMLQSWNRHCASLEATGLWCGAADDMLNLLYWCDGQLRLVRQQRGVDVDGLLALELARLDRAMPLKRYWTGAAMPAGWLELAA